VALEVTVLGAGSWGTALAVHLARIGHRVRLWSIETAVVEEMRERRANATYLPDVSLPANVYPTLSLDEALSGTGLVVAAVPSHAMRMVMREAAGTIPESTIIVSVAKGLELDSLLRMSQVIDQETGGRHAVAVLSGPSFAIEVGNQLPTVVSVACDNLTTAEHVQGVFRGKYFRLYATTDVAGVEIGGALKNTIAIAAGVIYGLGLGHNVLAALITRGLVEMSRLAVAEGGRRETLAGLTGLGDMVLTCTGPYSRNQHVGAELARGRTLADILASMKNVAEGVRTTDAALALGLARGIELPITAQMAEVLAGRKTPREALEDLMLRPQRVECDAG
jgi:glycerol-3-phosphate dehydrogenase (NAD(P)+)